MTENGYNKAANFLKPQAHECIKQHFVYDVLHRMTEVYTAHSEAVDGQPCMLTTYTYDGDSTRVIYHKEIMSAWDTDWEV